MRKLNYLMLNPKYFYLYFFGKPQTVIHGLTGEPESRFFELKEELDNDAAFIEELHKRTLVVLNNDFRLDVDHYFLYSLVRTIKPLVVLETGVFHGFYTACILKGIHDNYNKSSIDGRVISIDLPAYESIKESTSETVGKCLPSGSAPGWVIPEYLKERWQLNLGDSRDLLPKILSREKNISLFFHDSLHTYDHMMFEFESIYPELQKGTYLMSHDIHWNRAFRHFVTKYNQKEFGMHGFGIFKKE
jgi:hypothetical protein